MSFNFTPMQEKAINTDGNILVCAAAGSGKTAVLVERVIRKLIDTVSPVSADRLLIVTFTNAAAQEMRSRIEKRLYEEISKNPDNPSLLRQKHLIGNADICTIDSFCIKLVRENFEKCGIEPDFKVNDGSQTAAIANAVMSEIIDEQLVSLSDEFKMLLELTGCEYDEKNLTDAILRLYSHSRLLPFPEIFLEQLALPYEEDFSVGNAWYDASFNYVLRYLAEASHCVEKMEDVAKFVDKNGEKYIIYAQSLAQLVNDLTVSARLRDWDSFYNAIHSVVVRSVPSGDKDDIFANQFKEYKKSVSDILKELLWIFTFDRTENESAIKRYLPSVKLLVNLVNDYSKRIFEAYKRENIFTFSDTEQMALNLLCKYEDGSIVMRDEAQLLTERYDEILVDEFQDVNNLQNMLFYILSNREEKLFVVGDVKQSIYGFRGSNPDNFVQKKNRYIAVDEAKAEDSKKIILCDNFRSRKGVCDTVNYFFNLLMTGGDGGFVYNDEEKLNASGSFPESSACQSELLVVNKADSDDDDSLFESEAKAIAEYISSVMNEGAVITEGKTLRNAKYSDFAILLEKVKDKADIIADALKSEGIPVSLSTEDFLETVEISTVMSLLQIIDNPLNDVELLCVMMSPIFNFTAEEMAEIRIGVRRGNLYSAVVAAANINTKAAHFLEKIAELRRQAAILSLDRLISHILQSTDILNQMSALTGGGQRKANLLALIKYASVYCESGRAGIYGFIKYMKSLPQKSFKIASSGGEDSVKIMTMHHSKGLQFPVCIVANLCSKKNNIDSTGRILFSEKLGIAFNYYDERCARDVKILGHKFISDETNRKNVEERLRLLYVAMTRAQDRLCLVCSCKDAQVKLSTLSDHVQINFPYINETFTRRSQTLGDLILAAALLHPDCDVLRNMAEVNFKPIKADSNLKLTLKNCANRVKLSDDCGDIVAQQLPDAQMVQLIRENIAYEYPNESLLTLRAKSSVSQISKAEEKDNFAFSERPAFMLKHGLSAAGRGTAMHNVMQFIKLKHGVDISAEIERLVDWQYITSDQAESLDISALSNFFKSDVFDRICESSDVNREMRFLTEVPVNAIDDSIEGEAANASVIIQGAVDLCFEEDGEIVVVDFKTDRVTNINQLVQSYGKQLEIYANACEKIFKKRVKEKIIYSFHLSKGISL